MCYSGINTPVKTMRACSESPHDEEEAPPSARAHVTRGDLYNERGLGFREMEEHPGSLSFFYL